MRRVGPSEVVARARRAAMMTQKAHAEREADGQEGGDRDVAPVGLLGEDGHQAEADGGQETEGDASPVMLVVVVRGCARHGGCRHRSGD
jgi:hypothetical protein